MDSQPEIAVQGLSIGDRCPCDDGRPNECPHVANEEIVARVAAVRNLQVAIIEVAAYLTFQEVSEVVGTTYSVVERT